MGKVYGVGINDAGYTVKPTKTFLDEESGETKRRLVNACPFYQTWLNLLQRCYRKSKKDPTYRDCLVCEEWKRFSNFRKWMEQQEWEGKQLDKDILIKGNKLYSPETCVFVTHTVNSFITERGNDRGPWPIGVSFARKDGKFQAKCCNPFTKKLENLGYFTDPHQAHRAWLTRKLELARLLAAEQDDLRVAKALVNRYENYDVDGEITIYKKDGIAPGQDQIILSTC